MDRLKSDEELNKLADDLHRSPIRSHGYSSFKGYFMPKGFARIQDDILNFEVYDDDLWVTSFPKSGTTWMQYLVSCIQTRHDLSKAEEYFESQQFIEFESIYDSDDPKMLDLFKDTVGQAKKAARPRFMKSHLPWELLPLQIQKFERRPKIIHVVRDPRDVCVSYYYHSKLLEGYTGNFEQFWQLFVAGKLAWCPVTETALSFVKHKVEPNLLLLKYEDMKLNLRSVLITVAEFLEVSLTEEEVNLILPKLSFEAMKANPVMGVEFVTKVLKDCGIFTDSSIDFIRSGKSGGYKAEMDDDVVDLLTKRLVVPLVEAGLDYKIDPISSN